jgi:hypothetical protein
MRVRSGIVILVFIFLASCSPAMPSYEKAGFGLSTRTDPAWWARQLGAGWFVDWDTRPWPLNRRLVFWQMVRTRQDGVSPNIDEILRLAKLYPGQVWIIGNEPDNRWQDNITAEAYAEQYHDLYQDIKMVDPSAKIAIGGVSQPSELRLSYLDRVLAHYQSTYEVKLPVDWWTVHAYVLREERSSWGADIPPGFTDAKGLIIEPEAHGDLMLFKEQLKRFRNWMKENGYQDVPLAVTEFGILLPDEFGYSPAVTAQYLTETFEWLDTSVDSETGYPDDDYHLVQRWAWFSLADDLFPVADLADLNSNHLTAAGEAFQAFVLSRSQP